MKVGEDFEVKVMSLWLYNTYVDEMVERWMKIL